MKLELTIHDRKGVELNFGDIVKISSNGYGSNVFLFYCEVTYLEKEKAIAPFHTFSFHSVEKIDKLPDGLRKSWEERYNVWYADNPEDDKDASLHEKYLLEWRECEHLLEQKIFRVHFQSQLQG